MNLDGVFVESDNKKAALASAHGNRNLEAKGSYNTLDFVVRLRPDLHGVLEAQGGEISMREWESWDVAQAFSTYLHETIHWWQHVGTSAGLMLSFLQPAHAHMNRKRLDEILATHGPVKPLLGLAERLADAERQDEALNIVLNNWHDLDFFRRLVLNPVGSVESVASDPYFRSVGHSYRMAIGAASWLIGATVDPTYEVLPHPLDWEADMADLRASKAKGFYLGSPIEIPPLGLYEILEGQARFSQIQYLYGASGGRLSWDDFRKRGMLSGVYVRAFEIFLDFAKEEWPATAEDPIVGFFLLICDVALSASEGLFLPMTDPSSLIWSTDPAWRFILLCRSAKEEGSAFKRSIQTYSAQEYWEISQRMSDLLVSPSPRQLAEAVSRYAETHPAWNQLMEEDKTFQYREGNFPIRVLLGRFTRVQQDKLKAPQFFCWPGMCLTGFRQALDSETVTSLFSEHAALFLDRADRDVYPRLVPGKDEKTLQRLLDEFYIWVSLYEMTRQWLVEDGPFEYEYGWLTSKFTKAEMKDWADNAFKIGTSVHPDAFAVLR
ncbi:hypothetical protein ACSFBX_34760 [Variovorax sp. RB2P76]|uniref:hypothetical protein n=1 Tax=Variovorax sp. RB2P76 TaxID=3443736 RepID=UPI003F489578